ncbi:c-type cytochrome [Thiogranum longum]|jgi:cytochrome c5
MASLTKAVALAGTLAASLATSAEPDAYIEFEGQRLLQGRAIWMANCEGCHGYGIAGAPVPMQPADWQSRLEKDKTVLYQHAVDGFFGPDDTMMPARGGNPELSDDEVKAAVDYMTALASYYIQHTR